MNPGDQGDDQPGTVIPATQRKDGTWRKEIKIRPGFKNAEEMPKYMVPKRREEDERQKTIKQARARYEGVPVGVDPDEWRAMKEAEEKKKAKKRIRKKKDQKGEAEEKKEVDEEDDDFGQEQKNVPENWEDEEVVKPVEKGKAKDAKKTEEPAKKKAAEEEKDNEEGDAQKEVRKLKKKLRQIEVLEQKKAEGKQLNEDENQKLAGKDDLVALIEKLEIK